MCIYVWSCKQIKYWISICWSSKINLHVFLRICKQISCIHNLSLPVLSLYCIPLLSTINVIHFPLYLLQTNIHTYTYMHLFPFSSYIIAVMLGHVEAGFPYISDTATYAPESCIFSQFINMFAMLSEYIKKKKKKAQKIFYYSQRIDWHFARSTVTSIYVHWK